MQPTPETTVKEMWERLAAGIKEIQNHNASSLSYEVHYRYAYNMVLFKRELDPTACLLLRHQILPHHCHLSHLESAC